jgi:hypothetical protein
MDQRGIACFLVLFGSSSALANPAPRQATTEEIRLAIRDLDDEQFRVRSVAARKLLAAGKNSIEPLVEAANAASIATADRAVKILEELAFNGGEDTAVPARDALHRLARSKSQVREQAHEILKRQRGIVMDKMQKAGATFQFDDDKVRAIYLNSVLDFKSILPLLREFPEVEEISASTKKFGDAEFKNLLPLKNLKWINLFDSNIGDESLKLLKDFPKLESIPMGHTRVTDDGLKYVGELTGLDYLGLRGNNITDAGLVHLKKLTKLTGLTLQETKVTDAGLIRLKDLSSLQNLRLQSTVISDEGLKQLHPLKSLRRVDLDGTKVTAKGVEDLRKAIPEAVVTMRDDE